MDIVDKYLSQCKTNQVNEKMHSISFFVFDTIGKKGSMKFSFDLWISFFGIPQLLKT